MKKFNFKRIAILLGLIFVLNINSAQAKGKTDWFWRDKINGVNVNIVKVDLDSGNYDIGISTGQDKEKFSESFKSQIKRNNADIACNGNFFSSYVGQGGREYYGTAVKNGVYDHKGSLGSIGFDSNNKAIFFEFIKSQLPGLIEDNNIMSAVSGDPIIVHSGRNVSGEFKTTRKDIESKAARTAMGYTSDNQLLIITSRSATIREMGDILISLGANFGINLDGGASSALYYRGQYPTPAGRELNVVFYIKDRTEPMVKEEPKNTYGRILNQIGLIQGKSGITGLAPKDKLNRQEMITILNRLSEDNAEFQSFVPPEYPTFTDVPKTNWAYKNVEFAYAKGITKGLEDASFGYNQPVDAKQAALFLSRTIGYYNDIIGNTKVEYHRAYDTISNLLNINSSSKLNNNSILLRADAFEMMFKSLLTRNPEGEVYYNSILDQEKINLINKNKDSIVSDI